MINCIIDGINNINKDLHCKLVESKKNNVSVIRCNLNNEEDVDIFFCIFKEITATNWIVQGQLKNPDRVVYHKYWLCQHSQRNKVYKKNLDELTPRNTLCEAKIDILIKKNNRNTRKNDDYLKQNPPLCGQITLSNEHNHTINTSGSLKYLRINPETEQIFMHYFNDGMRPSEASRHHENVIMKNHSPLNPLKLLANGSINPIKNTVYHLHNVWRNLNFGSIDAPLIKLKENIELYNLKGISVNIMEETSNWVILVATPIMKRAQMLNSSKEIIFCDSSSSCDTLETTITILLTVTKAGAVPIALLLHPGQSTESYKSAFKFLKLIHPKCFGSFNAPDIFMTDDSAAEKLALHEVWPTSKQLLCHFHVAQKEWRWLTDSKNQISQDKRQFMMEYFKKV
ncbi:uncharacterized protein LOC126903141 [Daktulosphaira vitifoliae]|uniref:uncharacterized protein LOC126903141 n=1 Tax=Daktulosphaira vitifoliae TaxID=58002 RepID=UPI0021A9A52D|nr:uncharacterized protein LOC126903141 [Daktulosphaira vitifoliae]